MSRHRKVALSHRVSALSEKTTEYIAWWALCTAIMLAPLVFDGWMRPIGRMVQHAITGK